MTPMENGFQLRLRLSVNNGQVAEQMAEQERSRAEQEAITG